MYADSYKRRCYSILESFIVDYKEQVLITGIKGNMQCLIYYILPKEKELVTRLWESQTHQSTWDQLKQQRNDPAIQRNRAVDSWLYQQKCFAWDREHVNMHAIFLSNILHQLYKSVVTSLVSWITKTIIDMSIPK